VTGGVDDGDFFLAVLELVRVMEDARATRPGPLDLSVDLLDPDLDQVRDDTLVRRDLVVPDVGHDDSAVGVGLQLTAMRLSDPEPLREVEDLCQPVQRSPTSGTTSTGMTVAAGWSGFASSRQGSQR
jgi:hypothetical protein